MDGICRITGAVPDGSNQPRAGLSHWRRYGFGIAETRTGGSDIGKFTVADASEQTGHNTAELTCRNPPYDETNITRQLEVTATVVNIPGPTYVEPPPATENPPLALYSNHSALYWQG